MQLVKLIFTTTALFFTLVSQAQTYATNITLQSVTVYNNAAELSHTAKANVSNGTNEVIIKNVSNSVDENSIQVGASTDLTILSVAFVREFLTEVEKNPTFKKLKDSLLFATNELEVTRSQIATQRNAISILDANKIVRGENTGLNVAELQKMVDYYITKHKEITITVQGLQIKETKQVEIVNKLNQQLNEINNNQETGKGEIRLQVLSNSSSNVTFTVSYLTYSAAWTPQYDLKAKDTKSPLQLVYRANVVQNTGIDWTKIKLSISTSSPSQNGTAPILSAWFLNYYTPNYGKKSKSYAIPQAQSNYLSNNIQSKDNAVQSMAEGDDKSSTPSDFTTATETALNAMFEIDLPYDIPSDNKNHSVVMKEYNLPATYKYYAVPKLDKDVFLLAEIAEWENLNLVAGPANVIFDGTFIGKSFIDPNSTQDTLNLSLGRDKKIIVKREKVKDYCSKKTIGSTREHQVTYEIKVKNTRKEAIKLLLKDQVPVSAQKDITVDVEEISDAMRNEETGVLTWKLDIPSNELVKKRISYKVKYPKDKVLQPLN